MHVKVQNSVIGDSKTVTFTHGDRQWIYLMDPELAEHLETRLNKYKTVCQSCGHIEYHYEITDFAEERCDKCNSLSFGQKKVTRSE